MTPEIKIGLPRKEWKKVLYEYIETGHIEIEDFEKLNDYQHFTINELKKYKQNQKPKKILKKHHSLCNLI